MKNETMEILQAELGWQYYGGKHHESVFTKFYQAHILPEKFGVDKRLTHLSDLILNSEISRDAALQELKKPMYDPIALVNERDYVCKKLAFNEEEFGAYMNAPSVSHFDFPSYAVIARKLVAFHKYLEAGKIGRIFRAGR